MPAHPLRRPAPDGTFGGMTYVLFILGFVLLVKGGDLLVEGSCSIAKRFALSDMVVGLTIVSMGTSAPELVVNVVSSLGGNAELAVGNVIGSNIANVLLILGLTALFCPLPIRRDTLLSEIPFSLTAAILVGFVANAPLGDAKRDVLIISRFDGTILLFFFALFMAYIVSVAREGGATTTDGPIAQFGLGRSVGLVVVGCVALTLGGKWVVDGALALAALLGMSQGFVGLTVVAVGTSLPELVTSVIAARRGTTDLAVGNAIGSNIFNALWILGVSALIAPLPFNVINNNDILVLVFSSSLLVFAVATGQRGAVDRRDGVVFVVLYLFYLAYCINRG